MLLWLVNSPLLLCLCACVHFTDRQTGELQTESRSVALGNAKSVRVEIHMGAGELKIDGGAAELLEAEFVYNVAKWKPELDYSVSGTQGLLTIRQPEWSGSPRGPRQYEWDLRLNNSVPLEIAVHLGAGKSTLTLGTLALTNLDIQMGVGETLVDLVGDWKKDLKATIRGGVGKATVRLPEEVGVRVKARGGIGEIKAPAFGRDGDAYVNNAYGKSPVTLHVDVEGGIGEIKLELGSAPPTV